MTARHGSARADLSDDELLHGAYTIETTDDARSFYRAWADDYDDHMVDKLGYVSPALVADLLVTHLPDTEARVLDVGCGTGLAGQQLADRGFSHLDGVDLSAEMLAKAEARGVYRRLIRADLTRPLGLPRAGYDAIVSAGTFTHGHVGPEPLAGLVGLLRRHGLLAITVHRDIWASRGFDRALERLQGDGLVEPMEKRLDRFFARQQPEGWFVLCRRL